MNFVIEPMHFEYLAVQHGRISDLRHDFKAWKKAYEASIEGDYESLKPILPSRAVKCLDVGGGLSGISARLQKHYDEEHATFTACVLDGKADAPVVIEHSIPFNNATVTQNFLRLNGVQSQRFIAPNEPLPPRLDLVISIQAWGFHFTPEMYAERVAACLTSEALVVMDLRKEKPAWFDLCMEYFGPQALVLATAPKWTRWAFSRYKIE